MKKALLLFAATTALLTSCKSRIDTSVSEPVTDDSFYVPVDSAADVNICNYSAEDFDKLSLQQKLLAYYLVNAGLCGRDIIYDQNYRHNLIIRRTLERIFKSYPGDKSSADWQKFELYLKQIWCYNGIHDAYTGEKILPQFSKVFFEQLLRECKIEIPALISNTIFDPRIDNNITNSDPSADRIRTSAVNYYDPELTEADVEAFYHNNRLSQQNPNGKLILNNDGSVTEYFWKSDGLYGHAIRQIIFWLEKAVPYAENSEQAQTIKLLIDYLKTADTQVLAKYLQAKSKIKNTKIGFDISFADTSKDPLHIKASFGCIVYIRDEKSAKQIKLLSDSVQRFDHYTDLFDIGEGLKISSESQAKQLISASGNYSPAWNEVQNIGPFTNISKAVIRSGSKSIAGEFAGSPEVFSAFVKYSDEADKLFELLRGMLAGKTQKTNSENDRYRQIFDLALTDLRALCLIYDPKMVKLGILQNKEVAKICYDRYITTGLLLQLQHLEPGRNLEQVSLQSQQLISAMAFERGSKLNIISQEKINGKTYFKIKDYSGLRKIFFQIYQELKTVGAEKQKLKLLTDQYGTIADQALLSEVKQRFAKLGLPAHHAFLQPEFELIQDQNNVVTDVKITHSKDFSRQMLYLSEKYSFLPVPEK